MQFFTRLSLVHAVVAAPLIASHGAHESESKYIIFRKADAISEAVPSTVAKISSNADYTYSNLFNGFSASLTKSELKDLLDYSNVDFFLKKKVSTMYGASKMTYTHDESAGEGTCTYVLDTGTDVDHPPQIGNSHEIDLIVEDAATRKCPKGIVVNMSLSVASSPAINTAAIYIVKLNDTRASFSHYGVAADVFALATGIKSTWIKGGVKVESGTSMATSHVTGLAAYLLGLKDIKAPGLCNLIASMSLKDVIKGIPKNTVNLLIQNGRRSEVSAPINTRS
ncbi:serine protease precursor [Fusarium circinatum]|uniref:Serine protease n=1 Tax=Fusarium circinatum TaxID=48490 RepID=A0A8H5UGE3_FUSCI|nr:serine protease precursor [Fusarium circinatum]